MPKVWERHACCQDKGCDSEENGMEIPRVGGGPACDRGGHILTAVGNIDA